MTHNYPQRRSPRLQGYDYAQAGTYFVTICTFQRANLFGDIRDGVMHPNLNGEIAAAQWHAIPDHYPDIDLDAFVVMPNHVHGIILLTVASDFKTILGRVVNAYKGAVTARVRQQSSTEMNVWQSRYHDHIIRSETSLNTIRSYVQSNPARWQQDQFFSPS